MSADHAAKYEEFIIESNDGSRGVDIRAGVLSFEYYEDIFSPTVTAKVTIQSSGGGDIEDFKGIGGRKDYYKVYLSLAEKEYRLR